MAHNVEDEDEVVENEEAEVSPIILRYLNRLSDWFFVFSRQMSSDTGTDETLWSPRTP